MIIKRRPKHFIYKFLLITSIVGVVFNVLWIASVFFPSKNLGGAVVLFAGILLPLLWFITALGVVIYGVTSILTRKTHVRHPLVLLPKKVKGGEAIHLGILWVISGLMMVLIEFVVIGFNLCESVSWFCPIVNGIDQIFGSLGGILIFLSKPLEWAGLIRPR